MRAVPQLLRSGEKADIIADAAVTKCGGALEVARVAVRGCEGVATANAVADELAREMRRQALLRAVEMKAATRHRT